MYTVPYTPSEIHSDGKLRLNENPRDGFDNMLAFVMAEPPYIPWFVKDAVYKEYMNRQSINEKIFKDISTQETIKTNLLSKPKRKEP